MYRLWAFFRHEFTWWIYIWNESYIELRIWSQVSYDLRSHGWKVRTSKGFEPVTAIPVRCSKLLFQVSLRNCKNCVRNCEDHSLLAEFTWRANPMLLDPSPFTHAVEERLHCFQSLLIHFKCGAAVKMVFSKTNLSRHWFTDKACCTDKRTVYQGRNRSRWLPDICPGDNNFFSGLLFFVYAFSDTASQPYAVNSLSDCRIHDQLWVILFCLKRFREHAVRRRETCFNLRSQKIAEPHNQTIVLIDILKNDQKTSQKTCLHWPKNI